LEGDETVLSLLDRQRGFAAALLNPEFSVPAGLVGPDGELSLQRFSVYRINVVIGLTEALRAAFPAICRIVGEAFVQWPAPMSHQNRQAHQSF